MKDDPLFPTAAEREAFENFDPYAEPMAAPVPADGEAATGGLGKKALLAHDTRELQEIDWRRRWWSRGHCGGSYDRVCPQGCPCKECGC